MAKIQYNDKVNIISQPVPEVNKVTAANLNEIKTSVNINVDNIALNATDLSLKADISGNSSEIFKIANGLSANDAVNLTQLDGLETALQSNIDLKIDIASIVDNVTAGGSSVPLSAEQGKILKAEILALAGSLIPQGNWDASTNTPDISGTTETGYFWIVSVEGATDIGGITDWKVNDWAIKTADGWAKIDNTDKVLSVAGKIGEVVLAKADVGLSNVDNTTDANKPISTAQQTALDLKANKASPSFTGNATFGGNVGIGDGSILNVGAGRSVLTLSASTSSFLNFGTGTTRWGGVFAEDSQTVFLSDSKLVLETNANHRLVIDANGDFDFKSGNATFGGDVGIGTDSPDEPLHLAQEASNTFFKMEAYSSTQGADAGINVARQQLTGSDSNLSFWTNTGSALTQKMSIDSAGNVGIATASPTYKLDVNGTFRATGNATIGQNIKVKFNESYFTNYTTNGIDYFGDNQTFTIKDEGVDRLKIESSGKVKAFGDFEAVGSATFGGNVLLGSGTATEKLDVQGDVKIKTAAGSTAGVLHFGSQSDVTKIVGFDSDTPTDGSQLLFTTSSLPRLAIEANGDFDFKSGNATFGGSVTASSFVGTIQENFTYLTTTHTLTDANYNLNQAKTDGESTVTIPTGLSTNRSWGFSATMFNLNLTEASGVTITVIANSNNNDLIVRGGSSARLVATATANEFLLIK